MIGLYEASGDWWHGMVAEVEPGVFRAFLGKGRSKGEATANAEKDIPPGSNYIPVGEVAHMSKKIRDQLDDEFAAIKQRLQRGPQPAGVKAGFMALSRDLLQAPAIELAVEQVALRGGDTFQLGEWVRAYVRRLPITEYNEAIRGHIKPGTNWTRVAEQLIKTVKTRRQ